MQAEQQPTYPRLYSLWGFQYCDLLLFEAERALIASAHHHLLARPTAAATDLDEAESLATRGGMPIFLADVHLTRARLFRSRTALAHAKTLLDHLRTKGYRRHDEMLADAETAATHWPTSPTN